jgi:hypothetical protein
VPKLTRLLAPSDWRSLLALRALGDRVEALRSNQNQRTTCFHQFLKIVIQVKVIFDSYWKSSLIVAGCGERHRVTCVIPIRKAINQKRFEHKSGI